MKWIEGIVAKVIMAFLCITSPAGWTYLVGHVLMIIENVRGKKTSPKKSIFQVAAYFAVPAFMAVMAIIVTHTFMFSGLLDFIQHMIDNPDGIWLGLALLIITGFWAVINYSTLRDLTQGEEKPSSGPPLGSYPYFWL